MAQFDAILIPGGGLTDSGALPTYVVSRLDRAVAHSAAYYIALSAGSPHRPPPLDARGYPIYEASPAAAYLHARGIPQSRILTEVYSYDTIGNAFFARLVHTEPLGLRNLLIVNSEFHIARTEAIFRWVFNVTPSPGYCLSFEAVENTGLSQEALVSRLQKEQASLSQVRSVAERIITLRQLHQWIYNEHDAYAWFLRDREQPSLEGPLGETYGNIKC